MSRHGRRRWIAIAAVTIVVGLAAGAAARYPAAAIRLVAHVPVLGPGIEAWLADRLGAGRLVEHEHDDLIDYWTCSMHPSVRHLEPGTCPICSMDLVPVYKPGMEPEAAGSGDRPGMRMDAMPGMRPPAATAGDTPASRATFRIDTSWQQAIGVTTTPVQRHSLRHSLRTVGHVTYDENRIVDVNLRVPGWIEKLHVAETGQLVRQGDPLLELYSPDLVSTQREYLLARENARRVKASPVDELVQRAESLVQTTSRRLLLAGLTPEQVHQLDTGGKVVDSMAILSPAGGYVIEKHAVEDMRVDASMRLYRIADLSRVWVMADVYESEVSFVREGMRASLNLAYGADRVWRGRVEYVYPTLDRATRTVQVRLAFDNPDMALRPGMYGDVVLDASTAPVLAIPREAVIDLGTRQVVFVDLGAGRLQAREIATGPALGGMVPVRDGIIENESVVTSGNFLVDAESKIRGVVPLPIAQAEGAQ